MSRTAQALAWLAANPDRTRYAAAKEFGLSPSAVHAAWLRKHGTRCPTCGQLTCKTPGPAAQPIEPR